MKTCRRSRAGSIVTLAQQPLRGLLPQDAARLIAGVFRREADHAKCCTGSFGLRREQRARFALSRVAGASRSAHTEQHGSFKSVTEIGVSANDAKEIARRTRHSIMEDCHGRYNRHRKAHRNAPTGVRYSLNRTRRELCRSISGPLHSPPIIRAACRRQRRWVRRVLADIPPRRSHSPIAASPAARRSANAAQAPACRARMNSGI
jgi:hypothetical protein